MRRLTSTGPVRRRLWHRSAALLVLLPAWGCGGEGRPGGSGGPDDAPLSGAEAPVLPPVHPGPVLYGEILPEAGVAGPRELPGRAGEEGWGLEPASDQAEARFLEALVAACTPAPGPGAHDGALGGAPDGRTPGGEVRLAYPGRTTLNTLSSPEPFEGAVLRMVLDECDGDIIPIPFLVDSDASRTWILSFEEEGLRLAHDHREADGTPGEANLYGGFAHLPGSGAEAGAGHGAEVVLYFPADGRTVEARSARAVNVWAMALSEDGSRFHYRLYLNGSLRLEAVFDLTLLVEVPAAE